MEYRRIGNSGLKVSEIGLGSASNAFPGTADEQASARIIDQALDLGINFIDTAPVYADGRAEDLIGKALKGKRSGVIIATKFGHPGHLGPEDQPGGSRNHILKSVEASLRRLNTDYIDLYYIHLPDQETPITETLRALDDLVRMGKIRYIGCSNFAAWQLCEGMWTSRVHNLPPFVAAQSRYSLIFREIEKELVPCCEAYGVGVVPHGPLARGFLTGKYRRGQQNPQDARLNKSSMDPGLYLNPANFDKLDRLETFARERGRSVGELAIAWLLSHRWLGSVIAGVTKPEQVAANVRGVGWRLTPEEMAQVSSMT